MAGYLKSGKLHNVVGRIDYISNEGRQENIVDYYNTTDNEFWNLLAQENQTRHKETKAGGKCCEARELIIGIPQNSKITAEEICRIFKGKYDVECTCAIHQNNKDGVINRHCHLIFSERKKLLVPEITEERKAPRTYYYDVKGKKCKKAEAVKVVKKGTVLQEGRTRCFADKDPFLKSQQFVNDCKELFLKKTLHIDWSFEVDKRNKELSEKHIGKNNPKADIIKMNNEMKASLKKICNASDFMYNFESGKSLARFKELYNIDSFAVPNYEENINKYIEFVYETQMNFRNIVKEEVKEHNNINHDIETLETPLNLSTFKNIQQEVVDKYEEESKTRKKPRVIEFLKNTISNMFKRIKKLISLQDDIKIRPQDQIDVNYNRYNNLEIEEPEDYEKEQEYDYDIEKEDDWDLEL